jgi:hypothetical protein
MSTVVTLPYDPLWQSLDWAKEHCPSYITNAMAHQLKMETVPGGWVRDDSIKYYFGKEEDAVLFALRWS